MADETAFTYGDVADPLISYGREGEFVPLCSRTTERRRVVRWYEFVLVRLQLNTGSAVSGTVLRTYVPYLEDESRSRRCRWAKK